MQEQLDTLLMANGKIDVAGGGDDEQLSEDGDGRVNDFEDDTALQNIPEEEVQLVEDFLDKFVFISDSSSSREQVDLNLSLKALPLKVEESNIYRIDLMNFNLVQRSLIAFQNDDQDELFNFYDNRNRQRLRKITKRATDNETYTDDIKSLAALCLASFGRLSKVLGTQTISNMNMPNSSGGSNGKSVFSKVVPI